MKYDIVLFGGSGYTGKEVIKYLAKAAQTESFTWAVAGRSESKLQSALSNAGNARNEDLSKIPIIIADTSDQASLESMARSARVVLNCVGPYRFFGQQVVSACVKEGAHHLDISGEPQYLEKMQLQYHAEALEKKVFVIGACGFDSIPSDLGQMHLTHNMEGDVNDIEVYLKVVTPAGVPGPAINFATFQSAVHGFANAHELKPLRKALFPEKLPKTEPKLQKRAVIHKSEVVGDYCLPFPGSDRTVMMRTQRQRYHVDGERPAQVGCYLQVTSYMYALITIFCGAVFGLLASFSFGRYLLQRFPGFFSFGAVSKEGPSQEMIEETNFVMTLVGHGWPTKATSSAPSRTVTVTVSGRNIGYGSTCECIVQAALVLLQEKDRMPGVGGGVFTPGYAFKDTSLVERLTKNEVIFTAKKVDQK